MDLIDDRAILDDDEEDDESFDEETGEVTRKTNGANGNLDDSSDEEEDDDDEEAAAEVSPRLHLSPIINSLIPSNSSRCLGRERFHRRRRGGRHGSSS